MIIYIVGYGRSGSTALAEAIAKKLNAVNLGEVKYLYRSDKDDLLHPHWLAFKKDNSDLLNDASINLLRYDSITGFFLRGKARKQAYCKTWRKIFGRMGLKPEEDIIIDSSKTPLDSLMRGIRLNQCYKEVLFVQPKRRFSDIVRSLLKGKNSNLERGKRKNILLRILQVILVSGPHLLITNLLTLFYRRYDFETIELSDMERGLDKIVEKYNLQPLETSRALPMIYGNRRRKNKE